MIEEDVLGCFALRLERDVQPQAVALGVTQNLELQQVEPLGMTRRLAQLNAKVVLSHPLDRCPLRAQPAGEGEIGCR